MALAEDVVNDLYEEVAAKELKLIGLEAIQDLHEERERKVVELQKRQHLRAVKKCFQLWRKSSQKSKRQRETMLNFPPVPSGLQLSSQVKRFIFERR